MAKKTAVKVHIKNPSHGLLTEIPPDLKASSMGRFITVAENVRAHRGRLQTAPGYERVHIPGKSLDTPANLIFQPEIVAIDAEMRTAPIIGTEGSLYIMRRRARELLCEDSSNCAITFAVVGDSGDSRPVEGKIPAQDVANLIKSWSPDVVIHTGDLVNTGTGAGYDENPYEALCARWYYPFIGGYHGPYGTGPVDNAFYPTMGEHDWIDGPAYRFFDFFTLPPPEKYYTTKMGPVQFFFINSFGYGPASTGPGNADIGGTGAPPGTGDPDLSWPNGPAAVWLKEQVALSDTVWRIVVFHHPPDTSSVNYWPGYKVLDWPFETLGIDLVFNGHAHHYERVVRNGINRCICGAGGAFLHPFVAGTTVEHLVDESREHIVTLDESATAIPVVLNAVAERDYVPGSAVRVMDWGAMRVSVTRMSLVAEFITRTGAVADRFVLASPQRTNDRCFVGNASKAALSLEVNPAYGKVDAGGQFRFFATVHHVDGTHEDVTDSSGWTSENTDVATISKGKAIGIGQGSVTVTVSFSGKTASAILDVSLKCVDDPIEVFMVLDESSTMAEMSGLGTRMEFLKLASLMFIDSAIEADRFGVIAYSGSYSTQTHGTRILAPLGSNKEAAVAAIGAMVPTGATGTDHAVKTAISLMQGSQHVSGRRQVLLLVTDGLPNVVSGSAVPPSPTIMLTAMNAVTVQMDLAKSLGFTVVVVTIGVRHFTEQEGQMAAWATEGFYFSADGASELPAVFANLMGAICRNEILLGGQNLSPTSWLVAVSEIL